jgi:alpha-tubulin suppressor-like RCC1 family protein
VVGFTSGPKATFISMGLGHACAVSDGNVYCWGGNVFGQLGTGDPVERLSPTMVKGLRAGGLSAPYQVHTHAHQILNQ